MPGVMGNVDGGDPEDVVGIGGEIRCSVGGGDIDEVVEDSDVLVGVGNSNGLELYRLGLDVG